MSNNCFECDGTGDPTSIPANQSSIPETCFACKGTGKVKDNKFTPTRPIWACKDYGCYEHSWLSCYECIEGYEAYIELER